MVTTGQSNGALHDSPVGSCCPEVCQRLGSQLKGHQGGSIAGSSCCLIGESQAMTWDDDGVLIPCPLPTGLADWASLHVDELLRRVVQNMGACY